jgi:hypothetical protein
MLRVAGVPSTLVSVIEALLILGVVAALALRARRLAVAVGGELPRENAA